MLRREQGRSMLQAQLWLWAMKSDERSVPFFGGIAGRETSAYGWRDEVLRAGIHAGYRCGDVRFGVDGINVN